ncbi:micronuclear linker histone polyprotein-like [Branchiostoma lanceolatum]|uniref:micronuclear linker histone polyprotein-like n=1 Tax=Branchiostoma lanceolatum TaxID=7740 RepID=UPI0034538594
MLFYQVSDDPPGQAAGMAEKCKTCGCNCGGQGAKYREQAEEIRKRMVYSSHRIEVMESEFLEIRENLEDELNDTAEELQSLKDKFYRLERSHKSLQRVNQDLEEKLLSMAAQSERTKASLNRDILEMTEKLMNTRLALNQLEESNDRYRKECNLAAQLLQCNPHNFVSPKFSSLPPELQERLQQHMEQVTKNHRKAKASQSAPGAPEDAVVPTAVLAEVLQKPHPVRTVRGVGARREKILFDACVQTNPEDIDQGQGKVIKAKPLRFTAYGVDMGNTSLREDTKTTETGKPTGEWRPIRLTEGQAAAKETPKVRAFMPISRGKDTGQNLEQKPRQTLDAQRPSAPAPQPTQSGDAGHGAQVRLLENVNGNWESQEGAEARKVYSRVVGSSHTSPTKARKKEADQVSIGSNKGRTKKIGPATEETEPLLDGKNCGSSDGANSTVTVKREKIPSSQSRGMKSEADQTQIGSNRQRVKKIGPQGADGEETEPLLEKGAERNGDPGGKSYVKKGHPQTKMSRDIKVESGSTFEGSTKGKARKAETEETEPLLEKGSNRISEEDDGTNSVIHVKEKKPVAFPQATELSTVAGRARNTASVGEETVSLLEDGHERACELNDDSIVEVKEKRPTAGPQSKVMRPEQTAAVGVKVKVKKTVSETEEKPLIDLESNLETQDKVNGSDPSPQAEGPSLLSESTEMKPEADQAPVDSATLKASSVSDPQNPDLPQTSSPTSAPETKDAKPPSESTTPGTQQSGARPKSTVKKTGGTKVKKVTKTGAKKTGTKKKVKTAAASGEKSDKVKENGSPTKDKQNSSPTQVRQEGSDEPESQQHLGKDNTISKDNSDVGEATQTCPPKDSQTSQGVHKDAEQNTEEENKGAESRQEGSPDKEPVEDSPVGSQAEKEGMEEAPSEEEERAPRRRNSLEAAQLTGSLLDF